MILKILEAGWSIKALAKDLDVTPATIARWRDGENIPRAFGEGRLRHIYSELPAGGMGQLRLSQWTDAHEGIRTMLSEIREILHRRGRFASRNEALEEMSKLLFAHVMSLSHEEGGLCTATVESYPDQTTPGRLRSFVRAQFAKHLPPSLAHEMKHEEFELRIKDQEVALVSDILSCFDNLAPRGHRDQHSLRELDFLNDVFGSFLADSFAEEKQLGQYLTPREVVSFMVDLALAEMSADEKQQLVESPREFGAILDPSCGVASFLCEFLRAVRMRSEVGREWQHVVLNELLVGIDKSERMLRLALVNTALFGFTASNLHCANSLSRSGTDGVLTRNLEGKVGLILTNPPFGAEFPLNELGSFRLVNTWATKPPTTVDSELLFIERYLDWLRPGGQLLAIVPDSILTNKNLFADLRRGIREDVDLCSVISLPAVTFGAAGTTTKTSVLHLRKRDPERPRRARTFFAICDDVGFTVETRENIRSKVPTGRGDLPLILEAFANRKAISQARWVRNATAERRWDATYHASLPVAYEARINQEQNALRVSDVANLADERMDPRRLGVAEFPYIEISDVDPDSLVVRSKMVPTADAPSRARRRVRAGDVLVSTVRPERKAIGIVLPQLDGAICTTGFAVLRPRGIDPMTLAALLKTDFATAQVMRNNIGIAYPSIEEDCLLEVVLPVDAARLSDLDEKSRELTKLEETLRKAHGNFQATLREVTSSWTRDGTTVDPTPR